MADTEINIEMRERNSTNDGWIIKHPKSKAANVLFADGTTVEAHKADNAAHDIDVLRLAKTATGAVNTFTVDTTGTFDLTKDGNVLTFIPNLTTTSTTPTIAVDGQTAKNIKKADDEGTLVNLVVGDIKKNVPCQLVWSVSSSFFILRPNGGGGSNIKSRQSGVATIVSGDYILDIDISPVDMSKSIVRVCSYAPILKTGPGANPGANLPLIKFNSATSINIATNNYTAQDIPVAWEVIEFNNVKSKQSGRSSTSIDGQKITISAVDISKSMLFVSYVTNLADFRGFIVKYLLYDTTNIQFCFVDGYAVTAEWQVIEFN